MIDQINEFLANFALPWILLVVGEESFLGQLIANQPIILFVLVLFPILAIWVIALFLDFIKDSWKMPFGVILDILAILLFPTYPWLLLGLALISGIGLFFLANGGRAQNITYGVIGALRFFLIAPLLPLPEGLKVTLVLLPICTVTVFFLCITD